MQDSKSHNNTKLYFSHWSRKSYAVFTSLGRDVKISRLSVDMCGKALLKLNKLSMFFYEKVDSLFSMLDNSEYDELELATIECDSIQKNQLRKVTELSSIDSRYNNINKDIKDNLVFPDCLFVL